MRLSFVGELGWELHIPKDACLPVYRAVMAAGAKHGIINSGYRAIDSLSIEKGNCMKIKLTLAFFNQSLISTFFFWGGL